VKQQTARPSTLESLGLAAWAPTDTVPTDTVPTDTVPTDSPAATLGSLSGALGEFLPAPSPRLVVPAQRNATLLEALR
jgi:hypothetical protein